MCCNTLSRAHLSWSCIGAVTVPGLQGTVTVSGGAPAGHMMVHFFFLSPGKASNIFCSRSAMAGNAGRLCGCGSQQSSTSCLTSSGTTLPNLQIQNHLSAHFNLGGGMQACRSIHGMLLHALKVTAYNGTCDIHGCVSTISDKHRHP